MNSATVVAKITSLSATCVYEAARRDALQKGLGPTWATGNEGHNYSATSSKAKSSDTLSRRISRISGIGILSKVDLVEARWLRMYPA